MLYKFDRDSISKTSALNDKNIESLNSSNENDIDNIYKIDIPIKMNLLIKNWNEIMIDDARLILKEIEWYVTNQHCNILNCLKTQTFCQWLQQQLTNFIDPSLQESDKVLISFIDIFLKIIGGLWNHCTVSDEHLLNPQLIESVIIYATIKEDPFTNYISNAIQALQYLPVFGPNMCSFLISHDVHIAACEVIQSNSRSGVEAALNLISSLHHFGSEDHKKIFEEFSPFILPICNSPKFYLRKPAHKVILSFLESPSGLDSLMRITPNVVQVILLSFQLRSVDEVEVLTLCMIILYEKGILQEAVQSNKDFFDGIILLWQKLNSASKLTPVIISAKTSLFTFIGKSMSDFWTIYSTNTLDDQKAHDSNSFFEQHISQIKTNDFRNEPLTIIEILFVELLEGYSEVKGAAAIAISAYTHEIPISLCNEIFDFFFPSIINCFFTVNKRERLVLLRSIVLFMDDPNTEIIAKKLQNYSVSIMDAIEFFMDDLDNNSEENFLVQKIIQKCQVEI